METQSNKAFIDYIRLFLKDNNPSVENQLHEIGECFMPLTLSKNKRLVEEHQVCSYFCFVESGILQHAFSVDGEETTTYLALRNSVTSSLNSFLNGTPSRKSIKALVESQLWVIDFNSFQELRTHNATFREFYHNLIEKQIILIDEYRIDLLTLTPEERYQKMWITEPKLLQEVPLHYLASFLGISSRHMSRIRKNIK